MTSIQDDHASRDDGAGSIRRYAAAVQGAVEGFVEALDEYDVQNEAKAAIHEAGELSRAVTSETRDLVQTPEMQQVGGYLQQAGTATTDVAHRTGDSVRGSVANARYTVGQKVDNVRQTVSDAVETTREKAAYVKEEAKIRGEALAESGRRAKQAPPRLASEMKQAAKSRVSSWGMSAGFYAGLGILAVAFLTVTIVWIALALTWLFALAFGIVGGFVATALVFTLIAGIALAVLRSKATDKRKESTQHVENTKAEVRHVAAPARQAFSRRRSNI